MSPSARRALAVAATLLALAGGGIAVFLATLDVDGYRADVAARLAALTGRAVAIDGPLVLDLSLEPSIAVHGVHLGNAAWSEQPDMLVVPDLRLSVALLPLLAGELRVRSVLLRDATVLLERSAGGDANWQLGAASAGAPGGAEVPALAIDSLRIEPLRVRYVDPARGIDVELALDEVTLAATDAAGPLTVGARGRLGGGAVELALQVGVLRDLLAGRATPLAARLVADGVTLRAEGELPAAGEGGIEALALDLQAPDLAAVATLAGRLGVVLPALPALAPVSMTARLAAGTDSARLSAIEAAAGEARLGGELAVTSGARPRVEGRLRGNRIAVTTASGTPAPPRRRVFDDTPLPWPALAAFDAAVEVELEALSVDGLVLERPVVEVALEAGVATVRQVFGLAGGRVEATLRLDGGERRLRAEVDGEGVVLGQLAPMLDVEGQLAGAPTRFTLGLQASGATPRELAAGAAGGLLVQVGAGTVPSRLLALAGGDVVMELVRGVGLGDDGDLALECGVVNLAIEAGVASGEQGIGIRFDRMNVVGGGRIDLGTETLDLALAPEPREGVGLSAGSTLAGMVAVRGTLLEPSLELTGAGLAKAGAKVGAAIATGGLSILAGALIDRITADEDPCATALGTGAATRARSAAAPAPATGASAGDGTAAPSRRQRDDAR